MVCDWTLVKQIFNKESDFILLFFVLLCFCFLRVGVGGAAKLYPVPIKNKNDIFLSCHTEAQ